MGRQAGHQRAQACIQSISFISAAVHLQYRLVGIPSVGRYAKEHATTDLVSCAGACWHQSRSVLELLLTTEQLLNLQWQVDVRELLKACGMQKRFLPHCKPCSLSISNHHSLLLKLLQRVPRYSNWCHHTQHCSMSILAPFTLHAL